MEVEIFTLCDFSQESGGKLFVNGVFNIIKSLKFPFKHHQFSLAIRMRFNQEEAGKHEFKVKMTDKNRVDYGPQMTGDIDIKKPKDTTIDVATVNMPIGLGNVEFKEPGKFFINLYVDGEWKSSVTLYVVKGPEPTRP